MPKRAKELSAIELKRLPEGAHPVGGVAGLYLQVVGTGRSWLMRATVGDKRREIGLGAYPEITLAKAREKAASTREMIRQGVDPVEQRKSARAGLEAAQKRGLLFAKAVDLFVPIKMAELSKGKYRDQWRDSIDKYALPELGQMLVQDGDLHDILRVLEPIWKEKTITADKLRRKLNEVLDYSTVKGHRSGPNPARWEGNLALVLPSPSGVSGEENYPALQLRDLSRFWVALAKRVGMGAVALRFPTMTATRAGAIRFMAWSEVDIQSRIWTVQPRRLSSKISSRDDPTRVPLTDEMVVLLEALPRQMGSDLVFWASRGGRCLMLHWANQCGCCARRMLRRGALGSLTQRLGRLPFRTATEAHSKCGRQKKRAVTGICPKRPSGTSLGTRSNGRTRERIWWKNVGR